MLPTIPGSSSDQFPGPATPFLAPAAKRTLYCASRPQYCPPQSIRQAPFHHGVLLCSGTQMEIATFAPSSSGKASANWNSSQRSCGPPFPPHGYQSIKHDWLLPGNHEWPPPHPPPRDTAGILDPMDQPSHAPVSHVPYPPPPSNTGSLGSTPQAATATGRSHVHTDGVMEEATARGQAKKLAPPCHPMSSGRTGGDDSSCIDLLSLSCGGISHRRAMYGPRYAGGHPRNGPHRAPG